MSKIFVNLPAHDLNRSRTFYTALGGRINPLFSDENAICVVWSDDISFMLLRREYFATFTNKQVVDPAAAVQTLVALGFETRAKVDTAADAGLAAGGSETRDPDDHGFMYQRAIADPDGNILELFFMEPGAAERGPDAYMEEQGGGDS